MGNFTSLHRQGIKKMFVTFSIFFGLHAQSVRLKAIAAELDRKLDARYGDGYQRIKQRLAGKLQDTKVWYQKTRSDAETSGTIPLEQKQAQTDRRFAQAGTSAARREAAIKQQLKEMWYNLKNR
jgi:hypothetical protein